MKIIIIVLIVFVVLWITKKIWGGWIVNLFTKKKKANGNKMDLPDVEDINASIFRPTGITRSFPVMINLEEDINGSVKITIAKIKEKEKKEKELDE